MMLGFLVTAFFVISIVTALGAHLFMLYTFRKWNEIANSAGLTGLEVTEKLVQSSGLKAQYEAIEKGGADHYDPGSHTVRLTKQFADTASVAAMAVAAHELGHAQQHEEGGQLIALHMILAPFSQIIPPISYGLILGGIASQQEFLVILGIALFTLTVIAMGFTLPVEIDASKRGLRLLEEGGFLKFQEDISGAKRVLFAAGMTYFAGLVMSLAVWLRYVTMRRR